MSPLFEESHSQASQESFVLTVLKEKTNGYYVELGGGWAVHNSNTYLLETKYNWHGVSFENDPERALEYNKTRVNKTLVLDAMTFDYKEYFVQNNFPRQIDYLQMDIHPAEDTLTALKAMPLEAYRFSVITYEHNGYSNNANRVESRQILSSLGYELVVSNVRFEDIDYEDWWVDPTAVPFENYKKLIKDYVFGYDVFT